MQRRCFLQHTIPWPAWASPIESGRASKKAQAQDGCDLKRVGEQVAQAVFSAGTKGSFSRWAGHPQHPRAGG